MLGDVGQWVEEVRARWWLYVLGYFCVTSLIGFVLKALLWNSNRIVLTVMWYPAILTWRLVRRIFGKRGKDRT